MNQELPTSRRAFFEAHGRWPRKGEDPQAERYSVTFTRVAPTKGTEAQATSLPYESPEAAAWRVAYSGPEVGPVGGSWPEDGRHVPRMVWRLAFNSDRRGLGHLRNP